MQPPAYNAVTPRTTLQPAHVSGTVPVRLYALPRRSDEADRFPQSDMGAAHSKPKKVEWPPAVRDYVRRAFDPANAIEGISNAEMQAKLKETISFFAERGAQESNDWPNHPLPQQILQSERIQAAFRQANSPYCASHLDSNGYTNPLSPSPAKKRKSQDPEELATQQAQAAIPPWRKTNLESRITFGEGHTDKRQKKNGAAADAFSKFDQADLDKRRQRFNLGNGSKSTLPWGSPRGDEDDLN
ncbi:MAG: hypothetical protein EOO77_42465, partial [Oxalobacteraceae bacterium]